MTTSRPTLDFHALLDLEQGGIDRFLGPKSGQSSPRMFGGQVIAQALLAACKTVKQGLMPHSMHAYFLQPGNALELVEHCVDRTFDGKSFATRQVRACQGGTQLLDLTASFHVLDEGPHHQIEMPNVPGPEELIDIEASMIPLKMRYAGDIETDERAHRPVEFRAVDPLHSFSAIPSAPSQAFWFRAVTPLFPDPLLHRAVLAYASDMMLLSTAMLPHGIHWLDPDVQYASLDHAVWFHGDVDTNQWLLYVQESPWAAEGRGMNRGSIFSAAGTLVASTAQEALIRAPS